MNFAFDEQQKSLGETVAALLADHPSLTAPDPASDDDAAVWSALGELGLFALLVPEMFGGVGLTLADLALSIEALGAGMAPPLVASTLIATELIARHGSDSQRRRFLPLIAAGDCRVALALTEAGADYGTAPHSTVTGTSLDGRKLLVDGADSADLLVVSASRGLWLVDPRGDGVRIAREECLDPSARSCAVRFESASIDGDAPLAAPALDRLAEIGATVQSGLLTGIAGRMLHAAVDYAKTREQFGRPIGAFQAIKHRCADMAVALEAARSAAYYAFWTAADGGSGHGAAASMAKAYCGDVARSICNETIQVHGGMGFTWELGLHRYLRRSKLLEHGFGDTAFHLERVMAHALAQRGIGDSARRDAA